MPATRRSTTSRSRSRPAKRRRTRARRGRRAVAWPALNQRQRDLLGLALVALGVFLGVVLYDHGNGGGAGRDLSSALAWLVGAVRYGVPPALVIGGAALLLRPVLPALRPLRAGAICLFASVTLAFAAGTFGVGPAGARRGFFHSAYFEPRGGILGEAEFWVSHRLVSTLGADVLAVFLFLAGVLLLTGASVSSIVRATGHGVMDTTRILRDRTTRSAPPRARPARAPERLREPAPTPEELIVRATHVEAPALDEPLGGEEAEGEDVLSFEEGEPDPEPDSDLVAAAEPPPPAEPVEVDPSQLTPQGRFRAEVTDDPDFVWELPTATRLLQRSTAEQTRPDTAGQERVAANLVEALGHFGVEAKVIGTVAGPHITRYELRLAPGTKVAKVAQLKDDLAYALAATDIRILAPIPGKQAVGVEVPNAKRRLVRLGDVFQSPPPEWSPLTVWLGKDVAGKAIGADLAKMPHLLVAGTTGAG